MKTPLLPKSIVKVAPHGILGVAATLAGILLLASAAAMENAPAYYGQWANGVPSDPNYFPIAVWLQSPSNATAYKTNAGINLFIGLWEGPTDSQLSGLKSAGMPVLCDQNATGLTHASDKTIMAWTHDDEPDNAQSNGQGGYGPPVLPSVVIGKYNALKSNDGTRPIYLNLGQGVAWDGWYGRGVRTGHPEDYYSYVQGCDIASFDIYPVNSANAEVSGKLWYVPQGIDRLRAYTGDLKPVWCWIECTKIDSSSAAKPTPQQVRSEVWMALIHGANGIGYFCHSWTPSFDETALLHDSAMLSAVKTLNVQIQSLAPALNSYTIPNLATASSSNTAVPIDIMVKQYGGAMYVFAAAMRPGTTTGSFTLPSGVSADLLGEGKQIPITNGTFSDSFSDYGVHLYKITGMTPPSCTLTSPGEGGSYVAPATIPLQATASATNGTVSKVEFYQGATKLGEVASSPYAFAWTNVAAGNYALSARVSDSLGITGTSTVVNVTVITPYANWRRNHFTAAELMNPTYSGDLADPDGDGRTNYDEYLAGTDPKDPSSRFCVKAVLPTTNGLTITWDSINGKTYTIERTPTLDFVSPNTVMAPTVGTGNVMSFTDENVGSAKQSFYRVLVSP